MGLMMTLAFALLLQDEFYKFPAETAWTYKRVQNNEERVILGKALGEKDGRVTIDWKENNLDGSLHEASEVAWSVKDGVLTAEARGKGDGAFFLVLPVLKVGSKKDDAWTTSQGESKHYGVTEVKVPAGTYKDAVHTQLKTGDDLLIDFYMVPKVGLVKVTVVPPNGADTLTVELKEFKPAKP
jgi:hypothetical protein